MFRTVYLGSKKITGSTYKKRAIAYTYLNQSYHARAAYDPDHLSLTTSLACGIWKTKVHTQGSFQ